MAKEQPIMPIGQDAVKEAIIAIGKTIIDKADDISNDIQKVGKITITGTITPDEVATVSVEKEYIATL